ncbi:MAG: hypothetical protein L0I76_08350 [Pseudonocardia sp.]|nr:hypothetical protein [Pseudonocardia sp.]
MTLDDVAGHVDKPQRAVTRRDVARWLVSTPGAAESLPELRRELMAVGLPLTAAFWTSAKDLLDSIDAGQATIGEVTRWLEATGSEPTKIIGLHVWDPAEWDRRPRARGLYDELVGHLETLVRSGAIDPDRLLSGDSEALSAYVAEQERWLSEPAGDGGSRMDTLLDEADDEFLVDWDAAEAEYLAELEDLLTGLGERPCPQEELHAATGRLRAGLASGGFPYDLLASGAGLSPRALPASERELWLSLAAGVVEPADEPPDSYGPEELSSWYALGHVDWLCAVWELARRGVGASAEGGDLAGYVATSDLVEDDVDPDDVEVLAAGFRTVTELWRALGAVEDDGRLTPLGWWGLPEALRRAWTAADGT